MSIKHQAARLSAGIAAGALAFGGAALAHADSSVATNVTQGNASFVGRTNFRYKQENKIWTSLLEGDLNNKGDGQVYVQAAAEGRQWKTAAEKNGPGGVHVKNLFRDDTLEMRGIGIKTCEAKFGPDHCTSKIFKNPHKK